MSTETETLEFFNAFEGINKPTITTISIYDYMERTDSILKEERLIKAFDLKLNQLEKENKLATYETDLKNLKNAKQLKTTGYKMIALGSLVTLEKWDKDIKAYLDKINYPYVTKETTEQVYDKKAGSLKSVQKIHIVNNLKNALETDNGKIQEISEFILEHFELSEEQVTGFNEIISLLNGTEKIETNTITDGHFIKANSNLYSYASKVAINRLEKQMTDIDIYIKKLEMSVNFLNWKIKRIQIRKQLAKSGKLDKEFVDFEAELQFKLKEGKTFTNLYNIAEKYGLNARPKKA